MAKFNKKPQKKQGNDKLGRILLLVLAVLFIVYAIWFFNTHTLTTTKFRYSPIEEVSDNPYFAASLMLKEQGKNATFVRRNEADSTLRQLWQDTTTAKDKTVILHHIGAAQAGDVDKMIDWVQAGGHLIVFSQAVLESDTTIDEEDAFDTYQEYENPLLVELGIYNRAADEEYFYRAEEDKWSPDYYKQPIKLGGSVIVLNDESASQFVVDEFVKNYAATPYEYRALYPEIGEQEFNANFASLNDEQKTSLKQILQDKPTHFSPNAVMVDTKLGDGRLTALDIEHSFSNPYANGDEEEDSDAKPQSRLAKLLTGGYYEYQGAYYGGISADDNAFLLNYLVADRQEVLFVPAFERTSLWTLMKKNLPFMLFAIFAIGVLALLTLPRQFGRRERILDDSDKNVLSYYTAIGQYLWTSDLCEAQVQVNRERLLEKIRAVLPAVHSVNDSDKLCHLIGKDCRLPADVVFEALYGDWSNEREFVAMTRAFARVAKFYL